MSVGLKERSEGNGKITKYGRRNKGGEERGGSKGTRGKENGEVAPQEKIRLSVGSGKMGMENQENYKYGEPIKYGERKCTQ
jgi:hypothetical protein